MFRRQGTPQSVLFEQQLAAEALRLREQAEKMQPSAKRDELFREARQLETASHLRDWLQSPGLKSPN